ncbi:hypothetical protein CDD81_7193 [Ophiocordyceps australis]|uniref:SUN domain-containing protein n=1 Tax=Ophiocordyceps australis TaxID=1399860 RepID=A0A2C5Y133_9HYPO|nr:hypothetical protein CDD81_7193 [Ophiocordyceps australis]
MPPKRANLRKSGAEASPAAEVAAGFIKPNLPPLQGTPNARRQYSYGAAAEPPPPRAIQTKRGKLLDLSSAVQNVLENLDEDEDELQDELADTPETAKSTPLTRRQTRQTGQGNSPSATPTPSPRKPRPRAKARERRQQSLGSDGEDARSFATENEPFVADVAPRREALELVRSQSPLRQSVEVDDDEDAESPSQTKSSTLNINIRANAPLLIPPRPKSPVQPPIKQSDARKTDTESQAQQGGILAKAPILSRLLSKIRRPNREKSNSPDSFSSAVQEAASNSPPLQRSGSSDGLETGQTTPTMDWWQLCNPWTYVKATFWALNSIIRWSNSFVCSIASFLCLVLSAAALFLLVVLMLAYLVQVPTSDMDDLFTPGEQYTHRSAASFLKGASNYLSSFGRERHNYPLNPDTPDMHDIRWGRDDMNDVDGIMEYLRRHDKQLMSLRDLYSSQKKAVAQLADILPKAIYLDANDGRLRVSEAFWHVLRENIVSDHNILTLDLEDGRIVFKPDWLGERIVEHLAQHRAFDMKIETSVQSSEQRTYQRMSTLWNSWMKENEAKAHKSLGLDLPPQPSGLSQQEIDERISRALDQQARTISKDVEGKAVSREEFLHHVQRELETQRSNVMARMAELQPQMDRMVRHLLDQAALAAPLSSLQRKEVTGLVRQVVSEAVGQLSFQEGVKGKIQEAWDNKLKYQINYFDKGHGATINTLHSTVKYSPYRPMYWTEWIAETLAEKASKYGLLTREQSAMGIKPLYESDAALDPWQGEGDCWCSQRKLNHRGKHHHIQLGIQLGYLVSPTHIVLEHMLPSASTDPGARPRSMEVYAHIEDEVLRQRVRDFADANMPDPRPDTDSGYHFVPIGLADFVKIGQFTYVSDNRTEGVFVHRLDEDLEKMGLATDEVIVRAVDNYGADDHTCFYRVRMYGNNVEARID